MGRVPSTSARCPGPWNGTDRCAGNAVTGGSLCRRSRGQLGIPDCERRSGTTGEELELVHTLLFSEYSCSSVVVCFNSHLCCEKKLFFMSVSNEVYQAPEDPDPAAGSGLAGIHYRKR